jgi:hypothetical protein
MPCSDHEGFTRGDYVLRLVHYDMLRYSSLVIGTYTENIICPRFLESE